MVGDYISRDYLLDEYDRQHQGPPGGARKIIAEAPAADVAPVRHGRWEWDRRVEAYRCSSCKRHNADRTAYCPNCGADLREAKRKYGLMMRDSYTTTETALVAAMTWNRRAHAEPQKEEA